MERSEGAIPVVPRHGNSPADHTRQQDPVSCHTVKTDGLNSGAPGGRRRLCKAMRDRLTDQANIIDTGKDTYRFKRALQKTNGQGGKA